MPLVIEEQIRRGEAFRDGRLVARIELTRRGELRRTRVALPGTGGYGYKESWIGHPSSIRFVEILDEGLGQELERLAAGARDVEQGGRDRGWCPSPLDVRLLTDETGAETVVRCWIDRPLNPYGRVERVLFGARHDDV